MTCNKNITLFLVVLLSLSVYNGFSQNQIDINLLKGTWVFDYEVSIQNINFQAKTHLDKMNASRLSRFEKAYKERKISFLEGKLYVQEQTNGSKINATWALKNNASIEVFGTKGTKLRYKIVSLNSNQLVLKQITDKGKSNLVFETIYYSRLQ